jgi:phenylacetate-coenzyme A ligase PaaK-like adenylate-forming protein
VDPTPTDRYAERCAGILETALSEVAAYRSWRALDRGAGAPLDERYAALPALTKKLMNVHSPAAFVTGGRSLETGLSRGEVELVATSGSTEDKVVNAWDQSWWNASEKASWALNAHARAVATGDHREAILSNPLNVGVASPTPLPFEARRLDRFLFLNELVDPLSWTDAHCDRMLAELERFRPAVLEANPSLLSRLCRFARRAKRRVFCPGLVTLTYEYPSLVHRRHIAQVFDAPIMSSYGTTEAGYVFIECERGRLHQNALSCRVDLLPFKASCGGPSLGKMLVTTFDNPWRALLRFDVGDLARLSPAPCPCGRTEGLTLASVEGRTVNLTVGPEGAPVTQAQVDRVLAPVERVDEYQLRQTGARSYLLRVACDAGFDAQVAARAEGALRDLYGPSASVRVEESREMAPESSGKYRLARALFPVDADSFLEPSCKPPLPAEAAP